MSPPQDMGIARRGLCLVLAAPSGAGKTTLTHALRQAEPDLGLSISWTTRPPRGGEQDGVAYHFHTQAEFDAMAESGGFLEFARVLGRSSYGTPRAPVEAALAAGQDMLFDIDWQGYHQLRDALPHDVVGLFILPPNRATLHARLQGRGTDSPNEIARRMAQADAEMAHAPEFDFVLVNHDLQHCLAETRAILSACRHATRRQTGLAACLEELKG